METAASTAETDTIGSVRVNQTGKAVAKAIYKAL